MAKEIILAILKSEKSNLERIYSIDQLGLFGSFVLDTATEKSDIDIAYEMKSGHYLKLDEKIKLEKSLQNKLNRKIDLVRLKYMNPAIRVKAEPNIIYV